MPSHDVPRGALDTADTVGWGTEQSRLIAWRDPISTQATAASNTSESELPPSLRSANVTASIPAALSPSAKAGGYVSSMTSFTALRPLRAVGGPRFLLFELLSGLQ